MSFKVGDRVKWHSHGSDAHGKVVKVAHEDGEVEGFHYRASRDDPRYVIELEDGRRVAHKEDALSRA